MARRLFRSYLLPKCSERVWCGITSSVPFERAGHERLFCHSKTHSKYTEFDNYYICERMVLFRNYFARKWRWSLIRKTSNKTRSNLQFLSL